MTIYPLYLRRLCAVCVVALVGLNALKAQETEGFPIILSPGLKLHFDTRLTFDAAAYFPSPSANAFLYQDGATGKFTRLNMPMGTNVSQARFAIVGLWDDRWSGRFDVDFANRQVGYRDIYIRYAFNPHTSLTIGHVKDPISIEAATSSRFLSVAAPMPIEFLAMGHRHWGITATHWSQHYWLSGGIYAGNTSQQGLVFAQASSLLP